jgi:hypothetical protein
VRPVRQLPDGTSELVFIFRHVEQPRQHSDASIFVSACFVNSLASCPTSTAALGADSEIRGLLRDAVCVNSLFFWRVYKVEPKNQLFLVWQDDVERIPVVPPLRP